MEFLFGTRIPFRKFWYFERRMFGKYLEVFHLKIWANPLSSCKIIHQTISHTFLSFTISTHRPLVHLTYIVFKQTLQFLPFSKSALFKHLRLLDLGSQTQVQMSLFCAHTPNVALTRAERWMSELGRTSTVAGGHWSDEMTILVRMKTLVQIA